MLGSAHGDAAPLLGRLEERSLLTSLLDDVATRGQALVLSGEPGIGKLRLLSMCQRMARERGMAVLSTTGVQSEAHLPFAGLHQPVRPVRDRASELRDVQRAALDAAFGLTDEAAPEHFRIAMAVLDLFSDLATAAPLLVVVEDAHWLDRPTSDVLAFVARRIESDPIVVLVAIREGYPSALGEVGLPEHKVVATGRGGRRAGGREHHDGVRPVRKGAGALASGRHSDAYASADRLFDPADSAYHPVISSWLIADLAEAAPRRPARGRARTGVAGRGEFRGPPGHMDRTRSASCPGARGGSDGGRRSLRRGAVKRPDKVAVPARQGSARIRPVAPTPPAGCRLPRDVARRARHLRRARVRDVGRAGATRLARIRRTQQAARARGSRSTDGAGAADSPASGGRAVRPRNRPAIVSLAPHDQHTPVPSLPEAGHHFAS